MRSCGIFEGDMEHARRLRTMLESRRDARLRTLLFTELSALTQYLEEGELDVLVTDEIVGAGVAAFDGIGKVLMLIEEEGGRVPENIVGVYRYQQAEGIVRCILDGVGDEAVAYDGETELIGVYSPVEKGLGTVLSLSLAKRMSTLGERALYVNLNDFSGLSEILPNRNNRDLSDVIYDYRNNINKFKCRFREAVCETNGVSYVPCAECAEDLVVFGTNEWVRLLGLMGVTGGYRKIVVDIGHMVAEPWKLWLMCKRKLMPVMADMGYVGQRRATEFETYMLKSGGEHMLDDVETVELGDEMLGEEVRGDFLERVEYGGYWKLSGKLANGR